MFLSDILMDVNYLRYRRTFSSYLPNASRREGGKADRRWYLDIGRGFLSIIIHPIVRIDGSSALIYVYQFVATRSWRSQMK